MSEAEQKVRKARAGLILDQPFFGALALRLDLIEDPSCQTAWVDGRSLGYNPEWVASLSLDELKGVLCHEVMHCVLQHQTRRGEREQVRWNVAGDYAINSSVLNAGMKLPDGALVDKNLAGEHAEAIYAKLPQPPEQPQGGSGEGKGGKGEGTDQQGDAGTGSDQAGKQRSGQKPDPGGCGEVRDATSPDGQVAGEAERAQMEGEWKVAARQAATQAKACGKLPGDLEELVDEVTDPKIDWREALRRFMSTTAKNDYRWFPPNRRHVHNGLYLPSARSEDIGEVVLAVDTSGSVSAAQLAEFAGEMTAILEEHPTHATVVYCDAQVSQVDEYEPQDLPFKLNPKGRGGTDFRPPFAWVEEHGVEPACMIYFTDGECSSFPERPGYPVLWALSGRPFQPPFGEVIEVTLE